MQTLHSLKLSGLILVAVGFLGCSTVTITAPLCGPESYDGRPFAEVPSNVVGCYSVPNGTFGFGGSNAYFHREIDNHYIWIDRSAKGRVTVSPTRDQRRLLGSLGFSQKADSVVSPSICRVLDRTLGRDRLIVSDEFFTSLTELQFSPDSNMITVSQLAVQPIKLRENRLPYAVFPGKFQTQNTAHRYPLSEGSSFLGSNIGIIMIDNRGISQEDFLEKLDTGPNSFVVQLHRADPKFCREARLLSQRKNRSLF